VFRTIVSSTADAAYAEGRMNQCHLQGRQHASN